MQFVIRDLLPADASTVNLIAAEAFAEYAAPGQRPGEMFRNIPQITSLAPPAELIVAQSSDTVVGVVGYIAAGKSNKAFFLSHEATIRMLSVPESYRGKGIGRALTKECIRRAGRDKALVIALHTSPIMIAALKMYASIGFEFDREAPSVAGVEYGIYVKKL